MFVIEGDWSFRASDVSNDDDDVSEFIDFDDSEWNPEKERKVQISFVLIFCEKKPRQTSCFYFLFR